MAESNAQKSQADLEQMCARNAERLEALRARIFTGLVDAAGAARLISRSRSTVLRLARTKRSAGSSRRSSHSVSSMAVPRDVWADAIYYAALRAVASSRADTAKKLPETTGD